MSIYGQTEQSGVIRCGNNRIQFANFNMYGGNILSTGDVTATVETNFVRGTLEAAYFTGTQGFSFSGGNLKADRCVTNIDNRLGWTNLSDSIRFNNINTVRYGTFTIADGQAFTDGENIYTGVLAPEQVSTMQGKTLTPYQLHHFGDPDIQTVFVRDVEPTTLNGKQYYVFKCHVAAKEMTSYISAQLFDGDRASREYSYSVKEYGDWLLAHSDLPEFAGAVPLVKAMLKYSPMNYCHNALNGGKTNDKLINAVKALYLYSQAAKEYFKPNQDGN